MVEKALDCALHLGTSHSYPKQPWESNVFLREVLGNPVIPGAPCLPAYRSLVAPPPSKKQRLEALPVPEKKVLVRDSMYDHLQKHPDSDRACVLQKWAEILLLEPESTDPGKMLLKCVGNPDSAVRVLSDFFRAKATSTLRTRAGSLGMFLAWHKLTHPDIVVFPVSEERVYEYACFCRDNRKSASRMETLIGSLRYIGHTFKVEGALEAASSPRVQGASFGLYLNKAPRSRASDLTPAMLCWLEISCFARASAYDRLIAGMCMLCTMGRLRASDANRIRHAGMIGRYLEGSMSRTKTARSKEKATTFLPLVAPAIGPLGRCWLLEFIEARRELGLRDIPSIASRSHDLSFINVPSFATVDCEVQVPISSTELSDRLRALLASGFSSLELEGISSHSLKATLLSFANKWGTTLEVNELLGFHVNREHGSALNYTRDALCHPIRQLMSMVADLHEGKFMPDASRDCMDFPTTVGASALGTTV